MNKSILYVLILCCLPTFFWANSEVDLKLSVYSKKFSDNNIPLKYKRESAVVLVQEFHFVALNSQSYLFMKQKVLVNDMDGVDVFKNIYFAKGFKEDTVLITKKNGNTHFVKFTPDNNVLENNPTHFTFNEREEIFQYQKMELKDLEEGDILDFWYKINIDYALTKSFNFNNAIVYPIINRTIGVLHQNNFVVNARYFSSDYKFKTLQKNTNQQINLIELKDLEKSIEAFNIPIVHKNPGLLLAISSNKLPKYQLLLPDKIGAINEMADMEQIKKNVHQRVLANTKILELKNKILYFSTIANFGGIRDTDEKRKVAAAFYIFRDQVFNHSKLKEMDIDLFFYYCLKVCKANRWKYQIGFTYPKSYQLPTQILDMEDVHYFIEIEGLRIFPSLKNPHQELKFIPIETQGSLAYSTDFKKKYSKLKWLGSSVQYVDNNVISSEKKVNIDLINGKLLVRDSVYAFNYGKLSYQKELFKDINFAKTDYKHSGIRPTYPQTKKTSEEISAEKKAEKLHLDTVYHNYKMFLQTKGIPVDSLWSLNIKEEGRSEKYEKRIHITEYSTNALQQNNDYLAVSIADILGDEILCNNNERNPELGNLFFNYNKTYTIKINIPKGYNVANNLTNKELNNNNFINSITFEVKQNELIITVNHQVKNHKYLTKNWKEHLDFCLATQVYFNQKVYLQKN